MCLIFFSCWFLKLRNKFYYVGLPGLGLAGSRDLGFGFREMVGFPAPSKKPTRELKSPRAPKFEQTPATFVPIELLSV